MEAQTRETRKPVSFRIPRNEMALIEEYATTHRVSKSDALIHYLRKGIDADSDRNLTGGRIKCQVFAF